MEICGCLRMSCNASWQNFANMGSPAHLTITAGTALKFCDRSRAQSPNMFNLDLISSVIPAKSEPWPACQHAFAYTKLHQISLTVSR